MEVGVTDNIHYFIDRNFKCGKCSDFNNVRLYNIVGADLAEKGQILLIIADILSECKKEIYYSPYERMLPCALYLSEFNTLIASDYNNYNAEKLTNRYFDIGRVFKATASPIEEIVGYTMNQSNTYMYKSMELMGITDLLMKEYVKNGTELLKTDKLKNYAKRKMALMLEKNKCIGKESFKPISAITGNGYRFIELPKNHIIIKLSDNFIAASRMFVQTASKAANKLGHDTILARAVDIENSPLHLIIPDIKTIFVSDSQIFSSKHIQGNKICLERFYYESMLESRSHDISFFGEYIRKSINEAALYAGICTDIKNQGRKLLVPFISESETAEIASEIVYSVLNS